MMSAAGRGSCTASTDVPAQWGIASIRPRITSSGTTESPRWTGTRTPGAHGHSESPITSSVVRSYSPMQLARTRWGAWGQFLENVSVTTVSRPEASTRRRT